MDPSPVQENGGIPQYFATADKTDRVLLPDLKFCFQPVTDRFGNAPERNLEQGEVPLLQQSGPERRSPVLIDGELAADQISSECPEEASRRRSSSQRSVP